MLLPGLMACLQDDSPERELGCETDGAGDLLYPMHDGAWWVHRVTNTDAVPTVECRVVSLKPEPGFNDAFRALSIRAGAFAQRVQGLPSGPSGDITRRRDDWFGPTGDRTQIVHYCGGRLRVPDREDTSEVIVNDSIETTIRPVDPGDAARHLLHL